MTLVVEPGLRPVARMSHAGWIEPLGVRYAGMPIRRGATSARPPQHRAGERLPWVPLRQILNYLDIVEALGITSAAEVRDASLMPWGTADPTDRASTATT